MVTASVPAALQQQIDRWAATWIAAKFSRLLELRAHDPGPFNYPIAVFSEWRGKNFYLNARSAGSTWRTSGTPTVGLLFTADDADRGTRYRRRSVQ
jgi:hypothetical protein